MELFVSLKPDFVYENEKGVLVQLIHEGFSQVNVLKSKKGTKRGEHYHKKAREAFYVASGSVNLTLKKDGQTQKSFFLEGEFFLIPTYVWHSMDFPEDCTLVALYDAPVEHPDGSKDIFEENN